METKGFMPLYIPIYSPKLNSIENVFGMLKPIYRRRCPLPPNDKYNYQQLLETIIEESKNLVLLRVSSSKPKILSTKHWKIYKTIKILFFQAMIEFVLRLKLFCV